MEIAWV